MSISIGFKQRIMLASTLLVAVSLLVTNWLDYTNNRNKSMARVEQQASSEINRIKNDINIWLTNSMTVVSNAKEQLNSNDTDKKIEIAKLLVASTPLDAINFADSDGLTIGNAGVIKDYDAKQEAWYQDAKSANRLMMTEIYFDQGISDKYMFSFLDVQNNGVIGGDIFLEAVNAFINNVDFYGANVSLYDGKGGLISTSGEGAFGDRISDNKALINIEQKVLSTSSGTYRYEDDGDKHYAAYSELDLLGGGKWHIVIDIDESISFAFLDELLFSAMLTTFILIVLTVILLIFTLSKIYTPIITLKQRVEDLAKGNGDLTHRIEVKGDDDLAKIAESVNTFISQLQSMMIQILASSDHISKEIDQLKNMSDLTAQSLTIHSSETEQAVTAITEMSASASTVADNAKQTALSTKKASDEALSSKNLVLTSSQSVETLVNEVESAAACINTMNDNTQEIVSVLSVIGAIADQTNLLALNAAIEAARAGEQGRGFAVVADEVRSLAARTQSSTAEINDLLAKLTSDAALAVKAMDLTKESCQSTTDNTLLVGTGLDAMAGSIIEINELSTHIATASEEQSHVAEEINRNMASIQEMVVSLTENGLLTVASTDELLAENTQLVNLVSRFKLS
ncbi:methyl-accepting chemotaxis protein [Colwellia sp. 4_MG-2023]|uniref:methyl-accepting chemotaxis protein n=1 Tax=unclassified Colwellia TaxID=196834 RepID=UPI001C093DF8|nr:MULTISPECIES: methyl-accepting chemotaxis protein [unclassified Colwellia]MBU2924734.1 methyl-accepting chemotaxis protein [Colwellia sp. C2M11]MDO6507086.1 methyl-accepting chemotaxis protein [Colwellia sp. 5_MG-2023]MDO6555868.1 methyl-accepting chemotaxis protein [Colwellia sp. 4_MG-2023]MDO6653571.1 methyl-accepting chemotaxis protein [Colwellia sp. 3_MG-2023]MDO6666328.1 methyl-accepting chemotaxis protein [Colwellia sp. 2_MG-2023]